MKATIFLPMAQGAVAGQITGMSQEVLNRIDQRIKDLGTNESKVSREAGLSDSAIRNVRRNLKKGIDAKFSTRTLEALAPALKTSASWLLEGGDDPEVDPTLSKINREWADLTLSQKVAIELLVTEFRGGGRSSEDEE